jgi:tRNA-2-methylthio-N6-dimethylallyladenosine synthase
MEDIVAECRGLAARGVREITLLGQIVTSYGRRDYAHTDGISPFVQLLERVSAIDGIERIRFTSPHPRGFKQDLVDAYGRLPKLCGYVHLPMQSGSDRILRAMNRPYTRDRYFEIVMRREAADQRRACALVVAGAPKQDPTETFEQPNRVEAKVRVRQAAAQFHIERLLAAPDGGGHPKPSGAIRGH